MSYTTIEVAREAGVAWLRIARPEVKNALNGVFFAEMHAALNELAQDDAVRCVVLMGNGGHFSAGRDFNDRDLPPDFEERRAESFVALEYFPKPTIAAVSGYAITGGLTIATCCDLVIAADDAVFQDTHARFGIISMRASRLIELIGLQRAKEMLYTCRRVSGAQAVEIGLACKCVPPERLEAEARAMASAIAGHDVPALRAIKHVINGVVRGDQRRVLDLEELAKRRFHDMRPESGGLDRGLDHLAARR